MARRAARRLSWTLQCLAILASGAAHCAQDRAASVDPANLCSSARGEGSKRRPGEKQASLDRQPSKHRSAKPPASHTATRHKRRGRQRGEQDTRWPCRARGGPDSGMPAQRTELALRRRTGDVHHTAARGGSAGGSGSPAARHEARLAGRRCAASSSRRARTSGASLRHARVTPCATTTKRTKAERRPEPKRTAG
ncbi:hypothetical protein ERJ75_000521400 [Trypanosoma vivax]|nr:hypothetical protein ERJ75_000521400 [Trypanosoma vivax]